MKRTIIQERTKPTKKEFRRQFGLGVFFSTILSLFVGFGLMCLLFWLFPTFSRNTGNTVPILSYIISFMTLLFVFYKLAKANKLKNSEWNTQNSRDWQKTQWEKTHSLRYSYLASNINYRSSGD